MRSCLPPLFLPLRLCEAPPSSPICFCFLCSQGVAPFFFFKSRRLCVNLDRVLSVAPSPSLYERLARPSWPRVREPLHVRVEGREQERSDRQAQTEKGRTQRLSALHATFDVVCQRGLSFRVRSSPLYSCLFSLLPSPVPTPPFLSLCGCPSRACTAEWRISFIGKVSGCFLLFFSCCCSARVHTRTRALRRNRRG